MNSSFIQSIEHDASIAGRLRDLVRVSRLVNDHLPDLAPWFGGAVDEFMSGQAAALDLALGIRGEGVRLPPTQIALAERNQALHRAWVLFPGKPGESTTGRGERFVKYLIQFEVCAIPLLSSGNTRTALDDEALRAFQAAKVPTSWRRLNDIFKGMEAN